MISGAVACRVDSICDAAGGNSMREIEYRVSDDEYRDLCRGTGSDGQWNACERYDFSTGKWVDDDVAWDVMCGTIPANRISSKEAQQMIREEGPAQAQVSPSKGNGIKSKMGKSSRRLPLIVKVLIGVAAAFVVLVILAAIGNAIGGESSDQAATGADTEQIAAGVDTNQYATVVNETEDATSQEGYEVQAGRLTLTVPGYYTLESDSSSGADYSRMFSYETNNAAAIILIQMGDAKGATEEDFKDNKEVLETIADEVINAFNDDSDEHEPNLTRTSSTETKYKGMPGLACEYTGSIAGESASANLDIYLDQATDNVYAFLFLQAGDCGTAADDYSNMMRDAEIVEASDMAPASTSDTASADSSGVDPSLKEALDSYEEMMNEYCDFMERYERASSADALSMLSDYTSMLTKYTDAMSALAEIDQNSLGTEDLAYYLDVTNRVSRRLLEVAQ